MNGLLSSPPEIMYRPEQVIGNYRIVGKLGAGGMGEVWAAEHLLLGRTAAIKVLRPELSGHPETIQRFFNEAKTIAAIEHPGIVQVFDFGYLDGLAYIVMERLIGQTLADCLANTTRLTVARALRITIEVAKTLSVVHQHGVVHRDLKPENIFLIPATGPGDVERIKILDFGIAKVAMDNVDGNETRAGAILGTPRYMAPEQVRGDTEIDHRADIYSLSCVLFHMLCGRPPFVMRGAGNLMVAHMQSPPPVPESLNPAIPKGLSALILRGLGKRSDERPASMEAFLRQLEQPERGHGEPAADDARAASGAAFSLPANTGIGVHTTLGGAVQSLTASGSQLTSVRSRARWGLGAFAVACVVLGLSVSARLQWYRGEPAPAAPAAASALSTSSAPVQAPAEEPLATEEPAPTQGAAEDIAEHIRMVQVDSWPTGATIRREDSDETMGQTPLVVPLPAADEPTVLVLERDGFLPARLVLTQASSDAEWVELTPEPDESRKPSRQKSKRRSRHSNDPFGYQ